VYNNVVFYLNKTGCQWSFGLGVVAHSLLSGAHDAWMNMLINPGGIKDETFVAVKKGGGEDIIADVEKITKNIVEHVMAEIII